MCYWLFGIVSYLEGQLVLVDMFGLYKVQKCVMNWVMNWVVCGLLEGVDVGLLVIEVGCWDEEDILVFNVFSDVGVLVVLVVNKIDCFKDKGVLLLFLQEVIVGCSFVVVYLIFVQKCNGLDVLVCDVLKLLFEVLLMFGEDEIIDCSQWFLVGELVCEQLMCQLGEELLYVIMVEIECFVEDGNLLCIGVVIWVECEGQKVIVIGKGGICLKDIGVKVCMQMECLFGVKVFLEIWVCVCEGWFDDEVVLKVFGYE